jgi:uncharacterized protein YdhG (YjbR/CyaY superfamily)
MLPVRQIEIFIQRAPSDLQEIVLELRNIIASVAPDATEVVRWGGLSYFHKKAGVIISGGVLPNRGSQRPRPLGSYSRSVYCRPATPF